MLAQSLANFRGRLHIARVIGRAGRLLSFQLPTLLG
jgi:hypothetical protein